MIHSKDMKIAAALCCAFALFSGSAFALDPKQWEPIGKAMMDFPNHPTEKSFHVIETSLETLPKLDRGDDDGHIDLLCTAFLAAGSKHHGWPITGKSSFSKHAVLLAAGKGPSAAYVMNDRQVDASKLDVWWMSYLGSQDDIYLTKLLKYAGSPMSKDDLGTAAIVQAATWSFKSNCREIKAVREFAKRCLADPAYSAKKAFLESCLKSKS